MGLEFSALGAAPIPDPPIPSKTRRIQNDGHWPIVVDLD
jgi:hypothetical protein